MKNVLLFLLTIAVFSSCEIDEVGVSALKGQWQWESTEGGMAAHIYDTPSSTGKEIELEIKKDKKFVEYTNGRVTASGSYSFKKEKCIHDHTEKSVLVLSSGKELMIESLDAEYLVLSDENYDGLTFRYRRKTDTTSFVGTQKLISYILRVQQS